jgi:hypothetical protein
MDQLFIVEIPEELPNRETRIGTWKEVERFSTRRDAVNWLWTAWGIAPQYADLFIEIEEQD